MTTTEMHRVLLEANSQPASDFGEYLGCLTMATAWGRHATATPATRLADELLCAGHGELVAAEMMGANMGGWIIRTPKSKPKKLEHVSEKPEPEKPEHYFGFQATVPEKLENRQAQIF